MVTNFLITGKPGVGKTTLICSCMEQLKQLGYEVGGFYTKEIKNKGHRIGFKVVDLNGSSGTLADLKAANNLPRVGKYRVHLKEFEQVGVTAVSRAIKSSEIIIVDEIGKMELFSAKFCRILQLALDSSKPLIGTLGQIAHPLVAEIDKRSDIKQATLFKDNRNQLFQEIISWAKQKFVDKSRSSNN
jgi:nucleoside-triphosphatase THEP1